MKGLFIYQKGSISDYRDDELGRIKEYLKKIGIATVAYGREYQAPQMVLIPDYNEKTAEISRLQAEVAELRARLEKAVELPYAPDSIDIGVTKMMRSVRNNSVELRTPIYIALKKDTLEEASAMLKEL